MSFKSSSLDAEKSPVACSFQEKLQFSANPGFQESHNPLGESFSVQIKREAGDSERKKVAAGIQGAFIELDSPVSEGGELYRVLGFEKLEAHRMRTDLVDVFPERESPAPDRGSEIVESQVDIFVIILPVHGVREPGNGPVVGPDHHDSTVGVAPVPGPVPGACIHSIDVKAPESLPRFKTDRIDQNKIIERSPVQRDGQQVKIVPVSGARVITGRPVDPVDIILDRRGKRNPDSLLIGSRRLPQRIDSPPRL